MEPQRIVKPGVDIKFGYHKWSPLPQKPAPCPGGNPGGPPVSKDLLNLDQMPLRNLARLCMLLGMRVRWWQKIGEDPFVLVAEKRDGSGYAVRVVDALLGQETEQRDNYLIFSVRKSALTEDCEKAGNFILKQETAECRNPVGQSADPADSKPSVDKSNWNIKLPALPQDKSNQNS